MSYKHYIMRGMELCGDTNFDQFQWDRNYLNVLDDEINIRVLRRMAIRLRTVAECRIV